MATASFRFPLQAQQFELRPYQTEAVQDIRSSVGAGNKRVLLQASTGSGKTIIAADIMQRAAEKSSRVLFLAHRRELIDQCSDKLWRFGVRHGIIMAGRRLDLVERVQVASVQTLTSRAIRREVMELPPTDLIVIDEAHRSASDSYREIVERYPTAVLLGLTATPCRTDGKGLGHIYQDLICCPSMAELTEQGYLVPVRYFAPTAPDLEGVEVRAGDYVEKQLAERMDKAKLVGDVVEHWQKFGEDRQTIVFATNVRHSQHLAEKFQQAGVQAAHLDGKTEKPEREHLLADLGQGRLRVLCNCEVLTEGWDSPTVSCCVLAKPTKSLGRYLQMAGRVLRPAEGKTVSALLGPDAPGLSANTISRLKQKWMVDYEKWSRRDLSNKRYAYWWVDGVYANVRFDDARLCLLVIMGTTADGKKELIAVEDGYRESEQSWREVLRNLRARGLTFEPKLAVGDGALGFWKALAQVYGNTRQQRCWFHKTGNVLNCLPKAVQPKAKNALHQIWMAETRQEAYEAFDEFILTYELKFPKATASLAKDKEELLAFYDFPAEHWTHLRTTNPIESTFATVKLRTAKTRGCLSRKTMLTMVFQLCLSAQSRWRRLRGYRRLGEVIENVRFINGIREDQIAA